MKLDLEFMELHSPLFIDGINLGVKLYVDPKKNKFPISMWYDTDLRHAVVICKSKVALIENVASMTLSNPGQIGLEVAPYLPVYGVSPLASIKPGVKAQITGPGREEMKRSAQVSTPQSKIQGTPGKKPKFQGEESQGE